MQEDHRHAAPLLVNCYKLPACEIERNDSLQAPALSLPRRFRHSGVAAFKRLPDLRVVMFQFFGLYQISICRMPFASQVRLFASRMEQLPIAPQTYNMQW